MLFAGAAHPLTVILVVIGGVLGWLCVATVMEMVMTILMVTDLWQWLHRWFGPAPAQVPIDCVWTNCHLHFESSLVGMNSGIGGNIRFIDVGAHDDGLILRIPMLAPPFFRLWRWPFADRFFPPCLIPYASVTQLKGMRCQINVNDPPWPTMFISADPDTLVVVAKYTGLPLLP